MKTPTLFDCPDLENMDGINQSSNNALTRRELTKMMNLKRMATFLLVICMILPTGLLAACDDNTAGGSDQSSTSFAESEETDVSENQEPDKNAALIWKDEYADSAIGISTAEDVFEARYYFNGDRIHDYAKSPADGDAKYVFAGKYGARIVNLAEGYMFSFPGSDVTVDFSLSEARTKYFNETSTLTVNKEDQNPYGNTEDGWNIYRNEWLTRHIDNISFLSENNITSEYKVYTDLLDGYEVLVYNMFIGDSSEIEKPYYNIAVIRKNNEYVKFYLMVMKSTVKCDDEFLKIVKSFAETEVIGAPKNKQGAYELNIPDYWSDETKAYYAKLQNQTTVDWGAFHQGNSTEYFDWLWGETGMNHTPEIYMTYLHIGYDDQLHYFDAASDKTGSVKDRAEKHAGGNGFNGKPVLNLTYQFTRRNNAVGGYTPMFDILRGKYDDHFRALARAIKEYEKPVLFRLNNEMNTDWTDYSGIVTLLDPDIFINTWQRMYNIFRDEGVDNCIWIFNPIAVTTPYSDWGGGLNYFPGSDYVQMYGITYYEMNNETNPKSFKEMYTYVYNKSMPYFDNYPWIIGEFAIGAGGEKQYDWGAGAYVDKVLGRNVATQARWVKEMLECFDNNQKEGYEFCSHIKAAVWFSANDYVTIDGKSYITNYLKLDENTMPTIEVFRQWFEKKDSGQ